MRQTSFNITNLFLLKLFWRPITIPDCRRLEEEVFLVAGWGKFLARPGLARPELDAEEDLPVDAAPITVLVLDEGCSDLRGAKRAAAPTVWDLVNGLRTSAPLAEAPMTNLVLGAGGSGSVFPVDPMTNCNIILPRLFFQLFSFVYSRK